MPKQMTRALPLLVALSLTACGGDVGSDASRPVEAAPPTRSSVRGLAPGASSSPTPAPVLVTGSDAASPPDAPSDTLPFGPPVASEVWTEDPVEPPSAFDARTGEGTGPVGDTRVQVRRVAAGCPSSSGGAIPGVFELRLVDDASIPPACAGYGETVRLGNTVVVFGTEAADTLDGSRIPSGADALIFGFGGDDTILPSDGAHDNYIVAGSGDDTVQAPAEAGDHGSLIFGGDDADTLFGGSGRDYLIGGIGVDTLVGGSGDDELHGGPGADTLDACPDDLSYDGLFGGAEGDNLKIAFFAEIPIDTMWDYEDIDQVSSCEGEVIAP